MIGGPEEWMPQKVVADLFHISVRTLKSWQEDLGFPKPFYVGRTIFYRAVEVKLWQERHREERKEPTPKEGK